MGPEEASKRNLLVVVPGLTGDAQRIYVRNIVQNAYEKHNLDVVFINFRGLGGAKLLTPKLYTSYSYLDVEEAIEYVH